MLSTMWLSFARRFTLQSILTDLRTRPFRSVLAFFSSWLGLFLVLLFMPSPSVESENDTNAYARQVLTSGQTLVRAYEQDDFFPRGQYPLNFPSIPWAHDMLVLNLTLRCEEETDRPVLRFGNSIERYFKWQTDVLPANKVSPQLMVEAKVGITNDITPPWFNKADSALLFWEVFQWSYDFPLRIVSPAAHVFEIWPDNPVWNNDEFPTIDTIPQDIRPFISFTIPPDQTACDLSKIDVTLPTEHPGISPSRTFQARLIIARTFLRYGYIFHNIMVASLTALTPLIFLLQITTFVAILYILIVYLAWDRRGRPPFRPWSRKSVLTRHLARRLRPVGPRQREHTILTIKGDKYTDTSLEWENDDEDNPEIIDDESHSASRQTRREPQPLHSLGAFFTSPSPLDDLFATFSGTKYMIQPLTFVRKVPQSGPNPSVEGDDDVAETGRTTSFGHSCA